MKKKQVIRLTELDLHRIVDSSVKKILKEANIGRGKNTTHGSSSYADDFHDHTTYWAQTSENPYSSDGALMLANRLEKRLGENFTVDVYNEQSYNYDDEFETSYNDGGDLKFVISYNTGSEFQNIYYMMNVVKKMFGDNAHSIDFEYLGDDDKKSCVFYIDSSKLLGKEPKRDMLPKSKVKNNQVLPSITDSEFTKPEYKSYREY